MSEDFKSCKFTSLFPTLQYGDSWILQIHVVPFTFCCLSLCLYIVGIALINDIHVLEVWYYFIIFITKLVMGYDATYIVYNVIYKAYVVFSKNCGIYIFIVYYMLVEEQRFSDYITAF